MGFHAGRGIQRNIHQNIFVIFVAQILFLSVSCVTFVERDDFSVFFSRDNPHSSVNSGCPEHVFQKNSVNSLNDATGKIPSGLLLENFNWLGQYDECNSISSAHYCLVTMDVWPVLEPWKKKNQTLSIRWGACVPQNCSETDLSNGYLKALVNGTLGSDWSNIGQASVHCTSDLPFSAGFFVAIGVCLLLVLCIVIGTLLDEIRMYKERAIPKLIHRIDRQGSHLVSIEDTPDDVQLDGSHSREWERPPSGEQLKQLYFKPAGGFYTFASCFSITRNLSQLLNVEPAKYELGHLHGIRVLSMFWIILGHVYYYVLDTGLIDNQKTALDLPKRLSFQPVLTSTFATDTFLLISGLLVCFNTLCIMEKSSGNLTLWKFYLHRYLRLTPLVMFVILIYKYIFPSMGDGPLWWKVTTNDQCDSYWWTHLLYLNNAYPPHYKEQCLPWGWYLAVDMQLYIVSPLMIIFFHRRSFLRKLIGFGLVGTLLVSSFGITAGLIAGFDLNINLAAELLQYKINGTMAQSSPTFQSMIFDKPYCRVTPYVVGMMLGWFLHRDKDTLRRVSKLLSLGGWCVAASLTISTVYGLHGHFQGSPLSLTWRLMYGMFSELAWSLALVWLVYACQNHRGGYVHSFLSWSCWKPLGRLTFAAFLCHPLVIIHAFYTLQQPMHLNDYSIVQLYLSVLVKSYSLSLPLVLLIEYPMRNIENLIFTRKH